MMVGMARRLVVPEDLARAAATEGREGWLAGLPVLVERIAAGWRIEVDDPFLPGGQTAWVAPARDEAGHDLVLKVCWPHPEAAHEADGLRAWDGAGAVRLHRAQELAAARILLLERCRPGTPLRAAAPGEHDRVLASLLRRLWIKPPPGHRFRPLAQMCDDWADGFERDFASDRRGLDPGLARAGLEMLRTLPATAHRTAVLCTDLHAGNVLASQREPWLVIDPKPFVGDPAYDAVQHMLNCDERLAADPAGLSDRMASLLELDADRVRLWLFARCAQESLHDLTMREPARRLAP